MKLTQEQVIAAIGLYAKAQGFEGTPYVKLIVQDTGRADVTVTAEVLQSSPASER